ncbi:MAG TPA: hypothetical protein VND64_32810 [Pirellulales bacterium]|nr:hypothetical protein [Pirellulales bacterium]
MAIELSSEQRHALEAGRPVQLRDGQRTYYIISGEQFERMRMLVEVEQADPSLYEAGEICLYDGQ